MSKYLFNGKVVVARNYDDAAEKFFGQFYYPNPLNGSILQTTYVNVHCGFATVKVYDIGDKQGSYWGIQAATPRVYEIKRISN